MKTKTYSSGILQYIPFYYVIWSDDLLSYSEISVVKNAIKNDDTLTKEDLAYLSKYLDKKAPPSYQEIKNWKNVLLVRCLKKRQKAFGVMYAILEMSSNKIGC